MRIAGLNKVTLLDYPERVAATVFVSGCNFRCPFCHNGGLALESAIALLEPQEVLSFLHKRKNILKGVCLTGGEPTLQPDLRAFIEDIKKLGYQVKLDTNGYRPEVLKELLEAGLLDYIAMDIKSRPAKYAATVGMRQEQFHIERIEESIELLRQCHIAYEFRTTLVKPLHTPEDVLEMGTWIAGAPRYFLQQYREGDQILGAMEGLEEEFESYSRQEMEQMADALRQIPEMKDAVMLRGVE